jgi:Zn-dependent peptidase ImmA (M78 family)
MVRRKLIRLRVSELLRKNGVHKAPVDVEGIAESLGIDVIHTDPKDDDLSGFLLHDASTGRRIIGVNKKHATNRKRFTIGHEIGHAVLHPVTELHVDRMIFRIKMRDTTSATGEDIEEREANLFAAEILMPSKLLREAVEQIGDLDEAGVDALAKQFGVSTQAMTIRLGYLGYVLLH